MTATTDLAAWLTSTLDAVQARAERPGRFLAIKGDADVINLAVFLVLIAGVVWIMAWEFGRFNARDIQRDDDREKRA
jgi:hypothetical protein